MLINNNSRLRKNYFIILTPIKMNVYTFRGSNSAIFVFAFLLNRYQLLEDIRPCMSLLNFIYLTKNYILDIIMFYSKAHLSAKFIISDSHWKLEN